MNLSMKSLKPFARQLPDDQSIDFRALRDFGTTNQLDYSAYFEAPQGVLGTVASTLAPVL